MLREVVFLASKVHASRPDRVWRPSTT